jgi:hypothetical protein
MYYKGKERVRELPLPQDVIGRLALEAEFRGLNTGHLIAQLIAATLENNMVEVVLGQTHSENLEVDARRLAGSPDAIATRATALS